MKRPPRSSRRCPPRGLLLRTGEAVKLTAPTLLPSLPLEGALAADRRSRGLLAPTLLPSLPPAGGSRCGPAKPDPRKALGGAVSCRCGLAWRRWRTEMKLSLFGPLRSVGLRSDGWRARSAWGAGAAGRRRRSALRATRAAVLGRGRAVHLARKTRAAHDAGESDHEARCARRPRPCGPRRLPRPAAPAPQAALLQGRGVPRPRPAPGPLPQAGEGDRRAGGRRAFARACLQRCGQAGRGARGRRRACVLRGAACAPCTLRELTRRRRAQRAARAELSGRRAPHSAQARAVGPQGRPPPSRVAAGLPAPLSRQCTHFALRWHERPHRAVNGHSPQQRFIRRGWRAAQWSN